MKAIVSERYGLEHLQLRELEIPALEDHQVLVRVRATSINPAEWYQVHGPLMLRVLGRNGLRAPKTTQLGADLAGAVEAIGRDVKEFAPGDEVFGTGPGAWAEYAVAREPRLVRKPANVSWEEAAAVPIAATTALQALRDHGKVQPGQKVLINGAAGGVGTYAVQLAKWLGAEVTAVCRTEKVEQTRELGADRVVDYTQEDFTRLPVRHDLMLDIAGSQPFLRYRRVLTPNATVVQVGAKMKNAALGPLPFIVKSRLTALGRSQSLKFFIAKINKDDLLLFGELLESGRMKSVLDRRFDLTQVADAVNYLGEGHSRGKNVIVP
jgi:NADPH:quinone reductase-like Zn-dependent oxidoreductase